MREAFDTNNLTSYHFASSYLSVQVLNISAGPDFVWPNAVPFDQEHGDAKKIDQYFEAESFDTVHNSHSLEHMIDPLVDALHR